MTCRIPKLLPCTPSNCRVEKKAVEAKREGGVAGILLNPSGVAVSPCAAMGCEGHVLPTSFYPSSRAGFRRFRRGVTFSSFR